MKINKITELKAYSQNTSKKVPAQKQDNQYSELGFKQKLPSEPKYYQLINNVNFMGNGHFLAIPTFDKNGEVKDIKAVLPQESGKQVAYKISNKATKELLLTPKGEIDLEAMDFFAEVFSKFYKEKKTQYENDKRVLGEIIEKEEQQGVLHIVREDETPQKQQKAKNDDDEWLYDFSSIKNREDRIIVAKSYLEKAKERYENSEYYAGKEAEMLLKMSKTPNGGINKSKMDRKIDIAVAFIHNFEYYPDILMDTLIEESRGKKGKIDISIIEDTLPVLTFNGCTEGKEEETVRACANIIKTIRQQDKSRREDAINALCDFLNKGAMDMTDEQAQGCFMNCYNPVSGNFEEEGADLLDELFRSVGTWIGKNNTKNLEFDTEDFEYTFQIPAYKMIDDYFALARDDETGEIRDEEEIGMSPEEFITEEGKKYYNPNPFTLLPRK